MSGEIAAWEPLESNPDVMNQYLKNLGVPANCHLTDVLSLDEDSLSSVPQPVIAVVLLIPCSDKYAEHCKAHEELVGEKEQKIPNNVYYMKQKISNACGTVALIHSVANNRARIELEKESILDKFFQETESLNPDERGEMLVKNDTIATVHSEFAQEGQSEAPNGDFHFIAFVNIEGQLYELDGRKSGPFGHGETSAETFLQDAIKVCQTYMQNDPEEIRFTVTALSLKE